MSVRGFGNLVESRFRFRCDRLIHRLCGIVAKIENYLLQLSGLPWMTAVSGTSRITRSICEGNEA